ncbi:HDOD domain-containing protein [Fundidesulfovibrio butyratiphilus]
MKVVNIAEVGPGAVLAQDVFGHNGRLLARKGTTLDGNHLRVFSMWGVTDVPVSEAGAAPDAGVALDPQYLEQACRLADAFWAFDEPSAASGGEMRGQCLEHLAERLSKGWTPPDPEVLCRLVPEALPAPPLEQLISAERRLCTLPDVYFKIQDALNDPTCTSARLTDVISKDMAMSAKLLRLVNSPAFSGGRQVDTLSRGVLVLGAKEISQLALSITVLSQFKSPLAEPVRVVDFWTHSLVCGIFAGLLAVRAKRRDQERFFVAGVLHDIGRLVMLQVAPDQAVRSIRLALASRRPLYEAERKVFGYDHTQVAARLLEAWRIPDSLAELVTGHHPKPGEPLGDAAFINMADALTVALQYGSSGQYVGFGPAPGVWEYLGLTQGTLRALILQMRRQMENIMPIFFGS